MAAIEGAAVPTLADAWDGLPRAHGCPPVCGRLRVHPADFRVDERLPVAPEGQGEHLWVHLRKAGWTTPDAAAWLGDALGAGHRAVSWAGLKDRHAVTTQWLSVHLPGLKGVPTLPDPPEGIRLLRAVPHRRKLRPGTLTGNRFHLVLRSVNGDNAGLHRRLLAVARLGVPNYFGAQRFGNGGSSLDGAMRLLDGMPVRNRQRRGLFLSAARAFLFNRVLADRLQDGSWDRPLAGDLMTFSDSGSLFAADASTAADPRLAGGVIHPSGPLPGRGGLAPEGQAGAREEAALAPYGGMVVGLRGLGARADRRPLRLTVSRLWWSREDEATWHVGFDLPSGSYATAVVREIATEAAAGADSAQGAQPARSRT